MIAPISCKPIIQMTMIEVPPLCETCGIPLTVNHIFSECRKFESFHNLSNISKQISQTLGPNNPQTYVNLKKKSNLYNLICCKYVV